MARLPNDKLTKMASWQNGKLVKWQVGTSWLCLWYDKWAKWQVGKMTNWWNNKLVKWQVGEMNSWWNDKLVKRWVN